ncbi:hypothetical protein [Burkholderia gladioli]|uniref:N-acetyltransferase domain-containing protein n=1 Tax=Burkholderia gladioli (strain BSR3) TaxID=999541 RepID=F2LCF0_BURGS|nr:hypothetical protein [Burkholderia gladioli]AEA60202.1 hypothetical protein bgla_1g15460 [Burkholderia gladioli BSR3]MBW5288273.1 hypothetical protein [Burkholderia gladioli]
MTWADLSTLPVDSVVPAGFKYEQLSRPDINELVKKIQGWYPDIRVGSARGFLDPAFYESRVSIAGEEEKDLIVYVCKYEAEIASMVCIERDMDSSTMQGRLAIVAPRYRNSGLAGFGPFILDQQARAMKIAMVYNRVSLKHGYAQRLVESAGFALVGIIPASDREMVEPGTVKHVPEALYVKVYASESALFAPAAQSMTENVHALWQQLFSRQ